LFFDTGSPHYFCSGWSRTCDPLASASQVPRITGQCHYVWSINPFPFMHLLISTICYSDGKVTFRTSQALAKSSYFLAPYLPYVYSPFLTTGLTGAPFTLLPLSCSRQRRIPTVQILRGSSSSSAWPERLPFLLTLTPKQDLHPPLCEPCL
jgi:hypothetical protein